MKKRLEVCLMPFKYSSGDQVAPLSREIAVRMPVRVRDQHQRSPFFFSTRLCSSKSRSTCGIEAPPRREKVLPPSSLAYTHELISCCHFASGKSHVPSERTSGLHIITPEPTYCGSGNFAGGSDSASSVSIQSWSLTEPEPSRSAHVQRSLPSGEIHTSGSKVRRARFPSGSATSTSCYGPPPG